MKTQLRQFRLLGGNTTFELGDYLTIRYTSLFRSSETIYDLSRIAPTPNRTRYVPVGWVIAAIFLRPMRLTVYPKDGSPERLAHRLGSSRWQDALQFALGLL